MKKKLSVLFLLTFITVSLLLCVPSCSSGYREYRFGAYLYTVENNQVTIPDSVTRIDRGGVP